jgi:hypothetical protein
MRCSSAGLRDPGSCPYVRSVRTSSGARTHSSHAPALVARAAAVDTTHRESSLLGVSWRGDDGAAEERGKVRRSVGKCLGQ